MVSSNVSLFDRIQNGSVNERREAVSQLVRRARRTSDPVDVDAAGLGLHLAGCTREAVVWYRPLVKEVAVIDARTSPVPLCRQHLRHLAEYGKTDEIQRLAQEQLNAYERSIGISPKDIQLREVVKRSLKSFIDRGDAAPADYEVLGPILLEEHVVEGSQEALKEALQYLRQGASEFASHPSIFQYYMLSLLRCRNETSVDEFAIQLERAVPEWIALAIAIENISGIKSPELAQRTELRTRQLLQEVGGKDDNLRMTALSELALLSAAAPFDVLHRARYAFGLMVADDVREGIRQAHLIAALVAPNFGVHFNVAQLLWGGRDAAGCRRHFWLAFEYALDEEQRGMLEERLSVFREPSRALETVVLWDPEHSSYPPDVVLLWDSICPNQIG